MGFFPLQYWIMKLKVTTKIFPGKISNEGFSIFSWNDKLNTFTYRVLMKSYPGLVHRKVLKIFFFDNSKSCFLQRDDGWSFLTSKKLHVSAFSDFSSTLFLKPNPEKDTHPVCIYLQWSFSFLSHCRSNTDTPCIMTTQRNRMVLHRPALTVFILTIPTWHR